MNPDRIKALEATVESGYGNTAGIVVLKDGQKAYEGAFGGYTAGQALHVYSVTKSVFSALIGIAIGKGLIQGVEQPVLDFFPDVPAVPGKITLKNLLTMTAPYKYDQEPYEAFFTSGDWVRFALDSLGGPHTGAFRYSPIVGAHILSGILAKAAGRPILDFAREHLFTPLGIDVPRNVVLRDEAEHLAFGASKNARGWVVDPQGLNTASWGLCLTPMDMARLGQLYLNGGAWEGKQLIPAAWVKESTTVHSRWAQMGLSYGYLWWILEESAPIYAAMGDGGNVIYINEAKGLVVAMAASFVPDARDRIGLIMEYIEPCFEAQA